MTFTLTINSAIGRGPFERKGLTAEQVKLVLEEHFKRVSSRKHVLTITPELPT